MSCQTICDSVMNYDGELWMNPYDDDTAIRDEPDCSPHPFDIMALHALYRAVP